VARHIVSIAAAPGWAARIAVDGEDDRVVTLLAWALVEADDGTRTLVGLVQQRPDPAHPTGTVALADEVEGFDGYAAGALATRPVQVEY
jgi:hypothetical protein